MKEELNMTMPSPILSLNNFGRDKTQKTGFTTAQKFGTSLISKLLEGIMYPGPSILKIKELLKG